MHDNINQILASSRLYLGLAKTGGPDQATYINESDNLINAAIAEIRSLSHSLIPPSLDSTTLAEALEHIILTTMNTTGMKIRQETRDFPEEMIPDKLKLAIYRIVQEQLNNIIKYAEASQVSVSLKQEKQQTCLRIEDNGKGFDTSAKRNGVGLRNMKTRASLFNGDINIISSPGNGCMLEVYFDHT